MDRCSRYRGSTSPGVSTKTICTPSRVSIPSTRSRVVCARGVTMLSFCSSIRFISDDLPAFGYPTSATVPARVSTGFSADASSFEAMRRIYSGCAPPRK